MLFEEAILAIGKPYYRSENVAIYNCDSLDRMGDIPHSTFDLVVTSPPYNIGKEYEEKLITEDYLKWSECWLSFIPAILNQKGSFLLNLGYFSIPDVGKNVPISYLLWDKVRLFFLQEIVWNYGAGVACKKLLSPRNEKWLWYVKDQSSYTFNLDLIRDKNVKYPNQKKNGKLRCNSLGKNPSDVWQIAKVTSGKNRSSAERTSHPAQFPIDLINRIIIGMSNQDDIVFDPFLGSGSTAVSSVLNGRRCIGFEISESYCEIAANRMIETERKLKENLFGVNCF